MFYIYIYIYISTHNHTYRGGEGLARGPAPGLGELDRRLDHLLQDLEPHV